MRARTPPRSSHTATNPSSESTWGAGLGPLAEALAAPYASHYEGHGLLAADVDHDAAKVNAAFAQTLTVVNQGDVAMSGTVRIEVPALLRVQSTPAGCTLAGQSLTCSVPTPAGGGRHTVSVIVKAPEPGSGTTRATLVSSSVPDADPSDDAASVAVTITRK